MNSKSILRCLLAIIGLFVPAANAAIQGSLSINASATPTTLSIRDYQISGVSLDYAYSSSIASGSSVVMNVIFPPSMVYVGVTKTAHVESVSVSGNTVTLHFYNPLAAGSTGSIFFQTRFQTTEPDGASGTLTASMAAANATTVNATPITFNGINPVIVPPVNHGIWTSKSASGAITVDRIYNDYFIANGQNGPASDPVNNFICEDILPDGLKLHSIANDQWSMGTPADKVYVFYKTNTNSTWRQWGAGPLYSLADPQTWFDVTSLPLTAGEYVIGLRFNYGTVPGGGYCSRSLTIKTVIADPAKFITGQTRENCSNLSGTGSNPVAPYTSQSCVTQGIEDPKANYYTSTSPSTYGAQPGGDVMLYGYMAQFEDSSVPMVDPTIAFLLPSALEYVPGGEYLYTPFPAAPAPVIDVINNFGAPGQTLVRLKWRAALGNSYTLLPTGWFSLMNGGIKTRVRATASLGVYPTKAYFAWRLPDSQGATDFIDDTLDTNGDGNTLDCVTLRSFDITVNPPPTPPAVPSLSSIMLVRGELDTTWSAYPDKGTTVAGGKADYHLNITNDGGVNIKDLVIIDILPHTGDTGVVDLSPRGSQWSPFLAGSVNVPAGGTVYYSMSRNPCRPELVPTGPPGCEPPAWTTTEPADMTTVGSIKLDFTGLVLAPGGLLQVDWPMRAPLTAPSAGEIAWNSMGYTGKRGDTNAPLFAAEPMKTGIAVQPAPLPYYGDKVWRDSNANGIQDAGEAGLNGIRVELFRDNGDNIPDPATDAFLAFTMTSTGPGGAGAYRFSGMGPGNYFAVFLATDEFGITTANAGGNDQTDSDGQSITYGRKRAAATPVTNLVANEDDSSWDQGLTDRSGIPSVWATATMASGSRVIGGNFSASHGVPRANIAALLPNGQVDTAFNPGTGFDRSVRSLAVRGDGYILAGGRFTEFNGTPSQGVALLNPAGGLATQIAQPDTTEVNWVGIAGSKMFIAGDFGKIGGQPAGNFAVLNSDGTVNSSFPVAPGADGVIYGGKVNSDGSLFLVGGFSTFNGVSRKGIVKLTAAGAVDTAFNPGGGAQGEVYSLRIYEDGRMALSGAFSSFNGKTCNNSVRLNANGTVDSAMTNTSLDVQSFNATQ